MSVKLADSRRAKGLGSKTDLARMLGVTLHAVSDAIVAGRVTVRPDNWLDLARAAEEFRSTSVAETVTGDGSNDTAPDGGETYTMARTRKERAAADKGEVEAAKARGEVVSIADARATWYAVGRLIRERLLALPDAVAGELALSADQSALLRSRIAAVLTELPPEPPQ